jgi:hypothetical protein
MFYNGWKISGECGCEIRFQIRKVEAREFYITQLGWYATAFDSVVWKSRDRALHGKPDMFKMWVFKQSSSFHAIQAGIWADGLGLSTHRVQTVICQMRMLPTSFIVETLAGIACSGPKRTNWPPG